jgi:CIC family chloride channel protein
MVVVIEMTATTEALVPMMAATAAAVFAAYVVKSPPIYESLRARMSDGGPAETNASAGKSE